MSGRKCSDFKLERQREEKLKLLQAIEGDRAEASALQDSITTILEDTSDGLKTTFQQETREAEKWLSTQCLPDVKAVGMDSKLSALREMQFQLQTTIGRARQLQEKLILAFTQKADALGKQVTQQMIDLEQLYLRYQALFELWFEKAQILVWSKALLAVRSHINEECYSEAEHALNRLQREFTEKGRYASEQEDKHQKRLYLLNAIRQVCKDMGFEEVLPPSHVYKDKRGSRIKFTVDTLDRGRIDFYLALDGIICDSDIDQTRNHCTEEFGALSAYLESQYGIITKFSMEDGTPLPTLKAKDTMELPNDTSFQAEA